MQPTVPAHAQTPTCYRELRISPPTPTRHAYANVHTNMLERNTAENQVRHTKHAIVVHLLSGSEESNGGADGSRVTVLDKDLGDVAEFSQKGAKRMHASVGCEC